MGAGLGQGREQRVAAGDESPQQLGPAGELGLRRFRQGAADELGSALQATAADAAEEAPRPRHQTLAGDDEGGPLLEARDDVVPRPVDVGRLRAVATDDRQVQELREERVDQAQRRPGVVLAIALAHDQLVLLRVEFGAQQTGVVGVDQRDGAARGLHRGLDLGLPAVEAGDPRRARRLARDRQPAVGARQPERGRGQRIVVGDGGDVGLGDARQAFVRRWRGERADRRPARATPPARSGAALAEAVGTQAAAVQRLMARRYPAPSARAAHSLAFRNDLEQVAARDRELGPTARPLNKRLQREDGTSADSPRRIGRDGAAKDLQHRENGSSRSSLRISGEGMAFVMIATGATSRSRVRTLSVRPLVAAAGLAALALLGSGGAVGYWVAEFAAREVTPIAAAASSVQPALPFTLEQVGAISGRLFRLESEAAQLSKRIGVLGKESGVSGTPAGAARRDAARPPRPAPSGGPGWRRTRMRPKAAPWPLSTRSSAGSSSRSPASPTSRRSARSNRCACRRGCRSPAPS